MKIAPCCFSKQNYESTLSEIKQQSYGPEKQNNNLKDTINLHGADGEHTSTRTRTRTRVRTRTRTRSILIYCILKTKLNYILVISKSSK